MEWTSWYHCSVLEQKLHLLNVLEEGTLCFMLSLVYLDLFLNSKSDICVSDITFYIIYRKKVLFVTSQVFQMTTYAKLNDYT